MNYRISFLWIGTGEPKELTWPLTGLMTMCYRDTLTEGFSVAQSFPRRPELEVHPWDIHPQGFAYCLHLHPSDPSMSKCWIIENTGDWDPRTDWKSYRELDHIVPITFEDLEGAQ